MNEKEGSFMSKWKKRVMWLCLAAMFMTTSVRIHSNACGESLEHKQPWERAYNAFISGEESALDYAGEEDIAFVDYEAVAYHDFNSDGIPEMLAKRWGGVDVFYYDPEGDYVYEGEYSFGGLDNAPIVECEEDETVEKQMCYRTYSYGFGAEPGEWIVQCVYVPVDESGAQTKQRRVTVEKYCYDGVALDSQYKGTQLELDTGGEMQYSYVTDDGKGTVAYMQITPKEAKRIQKRLTSQFKPVQWEKI